MREPEGVVAVTLRRREWQELAAWLYRSPDEIPHRRAIMQQLVNHDLGPVPAAADQALERGHIVQIVRQPKPDLLGLNLVGRFAVVEDPALDPGRVLVQIPHLGRFAFSPSELVKVERPAGGWPF